MATDKTPLIVSDKIILWPVTFRGTRNNKVSHLFVEYVNGAVSGYPVSFCGQLMEPLEAWKRSDKKLPLCNHCGREFHKKHRDWDGVP